MKNRITTTLAVLLTLLSLTMGCGQRNAVSNGHTGGVHRSADGHCILEVVPEEPGAAEPDTIANPITDPVVCSIDFSQFNAWQAEDIKAFILDMRSGDRALAAKHFSYPFRSTYPYPDINNEEELIAHYDELVDSRFISALTSSGWDYIGYGVTCGLGKVLWGRFDEKGFRINEIVMHNQTFRNALSRYTREERATLHQSLRNYKTPILSATSEKYTFRIDRMADGTFRLAVWERPTSVSEIPTITVGVGSVDNEGSLADPAWTFRTDGKFYDVFPPIDSSWGYVLSVRSSASEEVLEWEVGK